MRYITLNSFCSTNSDSQRTFTRKPFWIADRAAHQLQQFFQLERRTGVTGKLQLTYAVNSILYDLVKQGLQKFLRHQ